MPVGGYDMATSLNLDDFTVEVARKPTPGVVAGTVPPKLAEYLAAKVPEVLANSADNELIIAAADAGSAKALAGYARAWGAQQTPQLRITKTPNRRDMSDNLARLEVKLESDVPAENRPGRRAK